MFFAWPEIITNKTIKVTNTIIAVNSHFPSCAFFSICFPIYLIQRSIYLNLSVVLLLILNCTFISEILLNNYIILLKMGNLRNVALMAIVYLSAINKSAKGVELGEQFEPMSVQSSIGNSTIVNECPDQINFVDHNIELQLIDAWEPWCGPCLEDMPHLFELNERYKNLKIISINSSQPGRDFEVLEERGLLDQLPYCIFNVSHQDESYSRTLGRADTRPYYFLLSSDGELLLSSNDLEYIEMAIEGHFQGNHIVVDPVLYEEGQRLTEVLAEVSNDIYFDWNSVSEEDITRVRPELIHRLRDLVEFVWRNDVSSIGFREGYDEWLTYELLE